MKKTESGMHEIKNKRRPRAVKNKKEGLQLHAKKRMSRTSKAIVTLCSVLVLVLGVYGVGSAFFRDAQRNNVDLNYGSPSVPVAEGEVYSLTGGYAPVDVFARLNWKFSQQSLWYAEMHGTVDTVIQQSVSTYKQYENGILISADLTESSLIKGASQFCYLKEKDRVIWRKPASKNYDGLNTEWQTGAPYNIMTIGGEHGFKATNGLPAYELSVYVIAEDTVAAASPVTVTEDGKFKITYDLKPETWQEEVDGVLITKGATAYYVNQMIFTGGLTTPPEFNSISVTFTFDENWQVFRTDIEEKYSAKYGPIAAPCVSTSTTEYEYNTEKAHSDAYRDYFYKYADGEVNNAPVEKEITALDCLAEGFGSVLTDPTVLELDLTVGDTSYHGTVDLDLSKADFAAFDASALDAKVKLGPLSLWVEEGNAYLNYGGLKFALKLDELISLVEDLTAEPPAEDADPPEAEEGDDLLSALGSGEFTLEDGRAELRSVLPLLGLNISVDFTFTIGEDKTITVEKVTADIPLGDDLSIAAQLGFGKDRLPALGEAEKEEYVPLMPYVNELIGLFSADVLHADLSYHGEGIAVSGGIDLRLKELALAGEIQVDVSLDGVELSKSVGLSYTEGTLYLDLDGVKVQATLEEGVALLRQYVALPELPDTGAISASDLGTVINTLLSEDFAALFSSSEENGLLLAVKGSELLAAFGVEFSLGDVTLTAGDGKLSATALGAGIGLTQGTDVALDTQGYTPVLPYVQTLIRLFSQEELSLSLSFAAGGFTAEGEIMLSLASQKAAGEIVLGYGSAKKTLSVIYEGGAVYLSVEGVRVKAGVREAVALISSLTGAESDPDAKALINKVLALDFGSVISLGEENDTLTVLLNGTELLNALGVEFELDTVTLTVDSDSVTATAEKLGVEVTIKQGAKFETNTDDYIEIVDYANTIATMIESGYLAADVTYTANDLTVTGKIELALDTLEVQGKLTLKYRSAEQQINIIYGAGVVYLELGGMKVSANVEEAVQLITRFVPLPTGNSEERDLIEELLKLDFTEVFTLSKEGDALSLAIAGTTLLNALGVEFELDTVTLSIDDESVTAKALGATITVKAGAKFDTDTSDYIEIVDYANTIATMIEGGYLTADVTYTAGDLTVTGKIELALDTLEVKAALTLQYRSASQDINIIYGAGVVYLELGGMKVSANVEEAVQLLARFVDLPTADTEERDLIEELLKLNFTEVFTLTQEGDALSLAIAGTTLLNAFGVEFDLDTVTLTVDDESVTAKALGATITVKAGAKFETNTDDYIEIVDYANTIATMIESGYLTADVTYTAGDLTVTGKIELALDTLEVQGKLTLKYRSASQDINIIYGAGVIYLELGGMKVSANVEEAVQLITRFVDLPTADTEERDLIEELLKLNFEEVFKLTKEGDALSLAIAGTTLLNALGVEFDLDTVTLTVDSDSVTATAEKLGVEVTIKQGAKFETNTSDYIEIVDYANTIATMIEGGYLTADVTYTAGDLTVTGKIELALDTLEVQGKLTLQYRSAEQQINIIYGAGVIYLELGGMKVSANVEEAVQLITRFVPLPIGNSEERDLIEELLKLDFTEVFTLSKEGDALSLAIAGTTLLNALGVEFELDTVTLTVDSDSVTAKAEALGVEVTIKQGAKFETNTDDYIEIVDYANTIATMIEGGYLAADVTYTAGELTITGKIELALDTLEVQGKLTLQYRSASQAINIIYGSGVIYLELGGMKVSANVEEVVKLLTRFVDLPTADTEERDLIEELLKLNFEEVFTLTQEGDALSLAIAGTTLLNALGVEFDLDTVTLTVDDESVTAKAEKLGVEVTIKQGAKFETNTDDYIEIVDYANTIATMIESGYLTADVTYTANDLAVTGKIELALDTLEVQGKLTLQYRSAEQQINIIYGAGVIYLELGGMKVSANVEEAVQLITRFVDLPTASTQERDLIEELLKLDFTEVFTLTKEGDALSLAIAGTTLLNALGVEFDLDTVTLTVDSDSVTATAEKLGVEVTIMQGAHFDTDTSDYIEIVDYANTIATMIESGYLAADVTYTANDLTITGKIELALDTLDVKAALTLQYRSASQDINIIYGAGIVYLELGGMKVSANVEEAVQLLTRFIDLPTADTEERDLIEELLKLNFEEVFTLTKEGDALSLAIAGTTLLNALGVEFDLDTVTLTVDDESVTAKALGATITVKAGAKFETNTDDYIEIVDYANTIATMIESGYLAADVTYTANDLTVTGKIELALDTLEVQGKLTLKYGEASQDINIIYGAGVVYLELGGMKVSANVEEAVKLLTRFIDLPTADTEERDLIEELLKLNFEEVFTLSKEGDALSLAIAGTQLLNALGVEFDLDTVTLTVDSDSVTATAEKLGVEVTITKGAHFDTDTSDYIEIVDYANTIATMIESGYLAADVSYTANDLTVTGKIELALDTLDVKAALTLQYRSAEQQINIIYGSGVIYLELGGMKVSANVEEAVQLITRFVDLPTASTQERDLIEELLKLDFTEVFTLTKEGNALSLAIAGTTLLNALGVEFELDTVTLTVDSDSVTAKALGATITVKAGAKFETNTSDYIEIVDYANTIATMIESGYLAADVTYTANDLTITGKIELALDTLEVQGKLTLKYGEASQDINIIYGAGVVYLELGGMKVSANVEEAVQLITRFIDLPTASTEERDLIEELLKLDFTEVFKLTKEGDVLSLAIAGTTLLKALGVEFDLDTVTLTVDSDSVTATAKALGATITVKAGAKFETNTDDYIEIIDYANTIATMIESGYLAADVSYTANDLTITGKIELALDTLEVQGKLTLKYRSAEQQINIIYGAGIIYLELGGMKVSANVEEAVQLLTRFVDLPTADTEERDLIEELLKLDFTEVFTLTQEGDALSLAIAGTTLLNAFGVEFDLDTVTLTVDSDSVTATAEKLGVEVTIKQGAKFDTDTSDYIEIVDYANTIATMIESGYLTADVTYTAGELAVTGKIFLDFHELISGKENASGSGKGNALDTLDVKAALTLKYGTEPLKQIGIAYTGNVLYLTVYGTGDGEDLKVSLGAKEAAALVTSLMGAGGDTDAKARIEALFKLDLERLLPVFEEAQSGNVLQLTLAGDMLLEALGVKFGLGDVQMEIAKEGKLTVKAAGATVTVESGDPFSVDTAGYLDMTSLLQSVGTILQDEALSLSGGIVLTVNDLVIDVEVENAVLSFADNGLKFYLHTYLCLQQKVKLEVFLSYEDGAVKLACGAIGAEIVFNELGSLEDALLALYGEIYTIVENMLVDSAKNPLPKLDTFQDLLARFRKEEDEASAPAWTKIVQLLTFVTTESDASVRYGDLLARLFFPSEGGFLGVELNGSLGDPAFGLDGTFHLKNAPYSGKDEQGKNIVAFPEMPKTTDLGTEITYLGTEEFTAIIGYLGSAVDILNATDLTLGFSGTVTSTDTETYPPAEGEELGTKYTIEASMTTHRGKSNLLHLDVDGKNLWVDTDVFAHASIHITATNEADNSLYIDLFILDGALGTDNTPAKDEEGKAVQDNMLDFYVTLSQFGPADSTAEEVAGYDPVRLYAPSGEILTILSSALPMLGVDADILNNYMIAKWLSLENVAQLKAFGDLVSPLLSGLLGAKDATADAAGSTQPAAPAGPETPAEPLLLKDYLKALTVTEEKLSIELNSEKLYGKVGLPDVTATLEKEAGAKGEDGSYHYGKFTSLDLCNIYDKTGTLNTSLKGTISYEAVTPALPSGEYQSFLGAEKLLLAIAKSATHGVNEKDEIISGEAEPHHYVLNNNFYIDGTVTADLFSIVEVTIDLVAVSVNIDENGELGINIRLEYQGKRVLVATAINGNSTVDITIKGGMVYMKRVQTTYYNWGWKNYETPITLYRAMPMANFTGDMLNQLSFILNFGDFIADQIAGSGSGSETVAPQPAAKVDFGTTLSKVLNSYSYMQNEDGSQSWDLKINGESFSNGILSNLRAKITADKDGYIRSIALPDTDKTQIKIPVSNTFSLTLNIHATLHWRNPGGTMEEGVENQTHGIADEVADKAHGMGGMIEKLNNEENGWTQTNDDGTVTYKFLEAKDATVSYKYRRYDGSEADLGAPQNVMVSTGQGGWAANTLFSELGYPAVPADDEQFAYSPVEVSAAVGSVLGSFDLVLAEQSIKQYDVTFYTKDETLGRLFDWDHDEEEGRYYKTQSMKYGSVVDIGGKSSIITGATEFEIEANPKSDDGRQGTWQGAPEISAKGAKFTATYPATVIYQSAVQFSIDGHEAEEKDGAWSYSTDFTVTDYTLLQPSAEGYTFLGWYVKDESGGWKCITTLNASEIAEITVEALWAEDGWVKLEASRSNRGSLLGKENYSATATVDNSKLIGAWASDIEESSAQYAFVFNTDASNANYGAYGDQDQATDSRGSFSSKYSHAHVKVEIVYTLADGTQFTFTQERHVTM